MPANENPVGYVTNGVHAPTFLRAAYFMENWGASLYALAQSTLPTFLEADRAFPMVATRDIGIVAANTSTRPSGGWFAMRCPPHFAQY